MKQTILLFMLAVLTISSCSAKDDNAPQREEMTSQQLRITVNGRILTAKLYDNPTTRSFIAQLPLTVNMDDYAGAEKVFYPPKKLSTAERHAVSDPSIGDINVYAPWGNIAIFYKNYRGSRDLVRIGRIESSMDVLSGSGSVNNVRFELVEVTQ